MRSRSGRRGAPPTRQRRGAEGGQPEAAPREAKAEFREWKRAIARMVAKESRLLFAADGSWTFALPERLVRLVYEVSIREVARAARARRPELSDPAARAEATRKIALELRRRALEAMGMADAAAEIAGGGA